MLRQFYLIVYTLVGMRDIVVEYIEVDRTAINVSSICIILYRT